MKLAYVLGEFPSLSETFILREILELRRRGFEISLFALNRPAVGVVHAEAAPLLEAVRYRPAVLSATSLAAMWHFGFRHPRRLVRAIGQTVAATASHPRMMLHCLRNVPTAAFFARNALSFGAAHVHAHFASMPADVAWMMSTLMACDFSISAHAAIFICNRVGRWRASFAQPGSWLSVPGTGPMKFGAGWARGQVTCAWFLTAYHSTRASPPMTVPR